MDNGSGLAQAIAGISFEEMINIFDRIDTDITEGPRNVGKSRRNRTYVYVETSMSNMKIPDKEDTNIFSLYQNNRYQNTPRPKGAQKDYFTGPF